MEIILSIVERLLESINRIYIGLMYFSGSLNEALTPVKRVYSQAKKMAEYTTTTTTTTKKFKS
jgi:hypothetical protein